MAEQDNNRRRNRRPQPVDNTYGHLQPQALDVEKAVLGALMIDKDAYAIVCEMLYPESFYEPRNQMVYAAIRDLSMAEKPVDMLTVADRLAKEGHIDEVGGPAYIMELTSRVASSANIEYHANIIAQKFLARQLISFASVVETKAFDETTDIEDVMQEAENSLFELSQRNMKKDYTHVNPVIKQALEVISKAAQNTDGLTGVPTGYHKLDDITSGWQASDLVIIAGRPAMGKTSFALSMAKNIAADYNVPMAFFSLEMSNVQLVNRLISNVCEIQGSKILNGQLHQDEWERLDKRINGLMDAPLYIDDTPGLSVFELRTKARRLVREHGVKIIMIDYLQLMNANGIVVLRVVRDLKESVLSSPTSVSREPSSRMPIWCSLCIVRSIIISIRMITGETFTVWRRSLSPSTVREQQVMCCSPSEGNTPDLRILMRDD